MKNLRPNAKRASIAVVLIYIVLGAEILSLISGYLQYALLQSVARGADLSDEMATSNDNRERIIGIVYLIVYIVSGITFIQWFRRAYFNLHLRTNYLSYSEGWAAGSWFVPILHYFRPYKIMKEMYQETTKILIKKGISISGLSYGSLLGWWWTLWITNNFIGQFVFRLSKNADTLDDFITSTILSITGNIIGIPLALVTIKVINDYNSLENLLEKVNENESLPTQNSVTL